MGEPAGERGDKYSPAGEMRASCYLEYISVQIGAGGCAETVQSQAKMWHKFYK